MRNLVVPTFWAVTPVLHHQPVTLHCYTSSLTSASLQQVTCLQNVVQVPSGKDLWFYEDALLAPLIWSSPILCLSRQVGAGWILASHSLYSLSHSLTVSQSHSQTVSHSLYIQSQSQYHSQTVSLSLSIKSQSQSHRSHSHSHAITVRVTM